MPRSSVETTVYISSENGLNLLKERDYFQGVEVAGVCKIYVSDESCAEQLADHFARIAKTLGRRKQIAMEAATNAA